MAAAERLRHLIESRPADLDAAGAVTVRVSIGVAVAGDESLSRLVERADAGLYDAKAAGRNTVRAAPSPRRDTDPALPAAPATREASPTRF